MRVVVVLLLIALVNASPHLRQQQNDNHELNPANDVETTNEAKQQKKRTLFGVGPYTYATAKHVGVHPVGFKYILGYGPIGYSQYARPVTLLKPLLHSHAAWKPLVHAVHAFPLKQVHVKPVVPIVPHFRPAVHHHPHVHVQHQPVHPHVHAHHQPVHPHFRPVHPHVHPVQPVVPVQPVQPEEPLHHVHAVQPIQPVQPVVPIQPVQPVIPLAKPLVPAVPNIVKPVLHLQPQWPQSSQVPIAYPFYKPLAIPNQIVPAQPPVFQQFIPQLQFQQPAVQQLVPQPLYPQPPFVQHLLPQQPTVQHLLPQPPNVQHFLPQPQNVPHLLPQPPNVQHFLSQPPTVQHLLPQPPTVQHLLPQPSIVQHHLPQPPLIHSFVPQGPIQRPVVHAAHQPPVIQHLLPQPPAVQPLVPQPYVPQPPVVQHLLPQPPAVQPLVPQPYVPQPPVVQHLLPQLPPQPSIFHIFKQFPFFKHVTPLVPVNTPEEEHFPEVPQAPVPPVTIHSPETTHDSGVSVQIPLHLPEHPNFRPGVQIIPQFPAQPESTDQDVHGHVPVEQPDFHHEQGGHVDNPFLIPQPQPQPHGHNYPAPQTPLYLPPHPLFRPGVANPVGPIEQTNSVQTEFSATFPKHPFVGHGAQGIHHPSISLEPPYGPEHNLGYNV